MARKYPKMTEEEKKAWEELDWYVRSNIMGYDQNQGLSMAMVLRLKGLRYGQYLANGNHDKTSNYSFSTILNTFKACSIIIKRAMSKKTFRDDMAKFNYAMAIVDNNIAKIYGKEKYAKRAKEEMEKKEVETYTVGAVEYTPKKKNDYKFADLW